MTPRRRINAAKLLLSKWTAVAPQRREKHFIVTRLVAPADPAAPVEFVELEAVRSRRARQIPWRELQDATRWIQGWK